MCPEARLSPSLEASLPQETAGKPYEQNLTQCYRCADLLIQDCLDIESDPFASSDKLQLNSISGARSMSPCEDKRHPGTPVLSTYGNIWDDSDSSDPGVVNIDLESDSSGSDVLRSPHRTRTKRYGNDAIAPPSTSQVCQLRCAFSQHEFWKSF
jgi:hypothetical protein